MFSSTPTQSGLNEAAVGLVPPDLLNELASVIERRTLMLFGPERRSHLMSTVANRAKRCGASDPASYIRSVIGLGGDQEMLALIDDLTINETTFFRTLPQLNMLSNVVLPEIIERKKAQQAAKKIQIWSAACSTGQEVYTLAILASEVLRFLPSWEAQVLGTDISPSVIETARRGVYPKARLDAVPSQILTRYFDDLSEGISIKEALRRMVVFQQHNLKDAFPAGVFDVIFCRNVLIYFSREDQARLAAKFKERLAPNGYLFIGHSESLQGLGVDFRLKLSAGGVAYQNHKDG